MDARTTDREVRDEVPRTTTKAEEVKPPNMTPEEWNRVKFALFLFDGKLGCKQ